MKNNLIKSVTLYWRQWITAGIVIICLLALGFCLFKITYALLTKPIPSTTPSKWSSHPFKSQTHDNNTQFSNKHFSISVESFLPYSEQAELIVNKKYFILKALEDSFIQNQCVLGFFTFIRKEPNRLLFEPINMFHDKKIAHLGNTLKKPIKYMVLEQSQLKDNTINCKNWISIQNYYENINDIHFSSTITYKYKTPKCLHMPSQLVAARSLTPNIIYLKYDSLSGKSLLCLNQSGFGIIQNLELSSAKFQTIRVAVNLAKK